MHAVPPLAFFRSFSDVVAATGVTLYVRLQGGSDVFTGFISSIAALAYILSNLLFGLMTRRTNRKTVLVLASAAFTLNQAVYLTFWYAAGLVPLETIFFLYLLTRAADGMFLGFFWPNLQSRISDEQLHDAPRDHRKHERRIRLYNFGWNTGNTAGNVLLILATIPRETGVILDALYILFVVAAAGLVLNLFLSARYFQDVRPQFKTRLPRADRRRAFGTRPRGRGRVFRETWVAFLVVFLYAFTGAGVIMTLTNHFTALPPGEFAVNLVLLVPLANLIRSSCQALGSSTVRIPERPVTWFSRYAGVLGVVLLLMAGVVHALPALGTLALFLLLVAIVPIGVVNGMLYASAMTEVIRGAGEAHTEFFLGAFEALNGLGTFLGAFLAGVLTEVLPYFAPYLLNAGIALGIAFLALHRTRGKRSRAVP